MTRALLLILLLGLVATVAHRADAATLRAEYLFDGHTLDTSGNNQHATNYGATLVADRFGNADSAYSFNGGDYMTTPLNSNFRPQSFSVWWKTDTTSGERSIVDSDRGGSYGHSLILGYMSPDGDLDVQYHNGYRDSGFRPTVGQWYHSVVNYTPSTIELWIDGSLHSTWSYTGTSYDGTNYRLGRHNASDTQWFYGDIDDVRFYSGTLNQTEIESLYTENPNATIPAPLAVVAGSVRLLGVGRKRRFVNSHNL